MHAPSPNSQSEVFYCNQTPLKYVAPVCRGQCEKEEVQKQCRTTTFCKFVYGFARQWASVNGLFSECCDWEADNWCQDLGALLFVLLGQSNETWMEWKHKGSLMTWSGSFWLNNSAVIDNNNSPDVIHPVPGIIVTPDDLWVDGQTERTIVCRRNPPVTSNTWLIAPINQVWVYRGQRWCVWDLTLNLW